MKTTLLAGTMVTLLGFACASPVALELPEPVLSTITTTSTASGCSYSLVTTNPNEVSWAPAPTAISYSTVAPGDLYRCGRQFSCLIATATTAAPYCIMPALDNAASNIWAANKALCPYPSQNPITTSGCPTGNVASVPTLLGVPISLATTTITSIVTR
ncbi:hypothetical protein EJ08DRAFT_691297 [Tothia fuscella]|uniref:Uncharacterized protein n=1 Tax=Tothia fuscella TaxID=1048955 RepID=A0A9P4P509_9PEZI|nr:hypothetical protein EJ08DRAFT_691297 [Tothia fuscella]